MALLQTTLNTVKVGFIEVVAIIRGCNMFVFCGALFKDLLLKLLWSVSNFSADILQESRAGGRAGLER
jgi:hypothetical protein